MLLDINIHDSWKEFLTERNIELLGKIENEIGNNYTPDEGNVLRFMTLDLNKVKVIILGQDPYKPRGVANGRAFQPSDLKKWEQPFRQVSIKNIIRNIYASYKGIEDYDSIPRYSYISDEIRNGSFGIKEPEEWFNSIEKQGVLLLNTSLTCEIDKSNSHKDIWKQFTVLIMEYICEKRDNIVWFLWGSDAKSYLIYVNGNSRVYTSNHPMMCSKTYRYDFMKNKCFKDTMDIINWLG